MTDEEKYQIMKKAFNSQNIKVYEYIDDEGRVFWSFIETKRRVDMYRLRLVDRVGLPFVRWIFELRNLIRLKVQKQDLEGLEQQQIIREINFGKKNKLTKQK